MTQTSRSLGFIQPMYLFMSSRMSRGPLHLSIVKSKHAIFAAHSQTVPSLSSLYQRLCLCSPSCTNWKPGLGNTAQTSSFILPFNRLGAVPYLFRTGLLWLSLLRSPLSLSLCHCLTQCSFQYTNILALYNFISFTIMFRPFSMVYYLLLCNK